MTPLHWIGETVRNLLSLIPLSMIRLLFVAIPVLLLVWVLRLPASETMPPERKSAHWSQNLKLWTTLALGLQIVIYLIF